MTTEADKPRQVISSMMGSIVARLYTAEQSTLEAMPEMIDATHTPKVREVLHEQERAMRRQCERLEQVLEMTGHHDGPMLKNPAVEALVRRTRQRLERAAGDTTAIERDVIDSAQKVEQLQIAGYETAIEFAKASGETQAVQILSTTLEEERRLDRQLSDLIALRAQRARKAAANMAAADAD